MKKKLIYLLCMAMMAFSLTACGDDDDSDANKTETTEETEETEEEEDEYTNNDRLRAFIAGNESVYFDRENIEVYNEDYTEQVDVFEKNTPYTLYDFLEKYLEAEEVNQDASLTFEDMTFYYIDCGDDGEKEVALKIDTELYDSNYYSIFVFKTYDEKLELISRTDAGYRTEATLYEYGQIKYGGANGAASYYDSTSFINADGEEIFVYGLSTEFDGANVPVASDTDAFAYDIIQEIGITDPFVVYLYNFQDFDENEDYSEMVKHYYCQCFQTDSTYEITGDAVLPNDGSKLADFELRTGLNYYSEDEMDTILNDRMKECGFTEDIQSGREVEWRTMDLEPYEPIIEKINASELPEEVEEEEAEVANIKVENPGWDYYNDGDHMDGTAEHVSLQKESEADNDYGFDTEWFENMGIEYPLSDYREGDDYSYYLYGDDETAPDHMILEDATGVVLADLDFSDYLYPDEYLKADEEFVKEYIHYAVVDDGILYVSIAHDTYATSAGHNGYIVALDMNDNYKVIWKTAPLTCNSYTFALTGDTIICGYGFTNEDDALYLINKNNGKQYDSQAIDTRADYIYIYDGKLQVRAYDKDYVYSIETVTE